MCDAKCNKGKKGKKMTPKQSYRVGPEHKLYVPILQKAAQGEQIVKIAGAEYTYALDEEKNLILSQNNSKITKESQTVSPKKVKELADDPDLGKVKADKPHALAADEPKPSEGVSEPSVPEAPNGGRLSNENTVEKAEKGPEIPAGGGMNPKYDQNEKNEPEKQDQLLGTDKNIVASNDEAIKVAGQMLKANLIEAENLPETIRLLSKATPEIMNEYRQKIASANAGLQKTASAGTPETLSVVSNGTTETTDLVGSVKSLFTLSHRNADFEKYLG